jgi:ribosomal subunit interface protein
MHIPPQITFRDMEPSAALEARIRKNIERLERKFGRLISCRVMVEASHRRHQQGKLFHVRIDVTLPGREVVVGREPAERHSHEDAHVAVRDAFNALRRQLENHTERQRGAVKTHPVPDHGRVLRLLPDRDCGFIEAADGSELYFHRNAVVNGGYDGLEPGDRVRYVAQLGESEHGAQASTVMPLGKRHLPPAAA